MQMLRSTIHGPVWPAMKWNRRVLGVAAVMANSGDRGSWHWVGAAVPDVHAESVPTVAHNRFNSGSDFAPCEKAD
jgi:hypothetical protein